MMNYFEEFTKYAFRLELLQEYKVDEEQDELLYFKKTASFHQTAIKNGIQY